MNKHTPGPWEYGEQEGEYVIWNPDIGTIATTCADMADQEANAALIAAAPELLEALQGLMDAFIHTEGNKRGNQAKTDIIKYNQPHVSGALNRARHAIAKAEGTK